MKALSKNARLVRPWRYSPAYRAMNPRRCHVFGVGANKSGTHSIAKMFAGRYRASHEEDHGSLIDYFLDWKNGELEAGAFDRILLDRDRYAWLEVDAAHTHELYLERLLVLFPGAKYVLTLRDCYGWLDSWINHCLNRIHVEGSPWACFREWRFGREHRGFPKEEALLQGEGMYCIDSYLKAWAAHTQRVLDLVPEDRLLIIRTHEISGSTDRLAAFAGVPADTLMRAVSHSYQSPKRYHLLREIPADYLRAKGEAHCGELMARFFGDQDYLERMLG